MRAGLKVKSKLLQKSSECRKMHSATGRQGHAQRLSLAQCRHLARTFCERCLIKIMLGAISLSSFLSSLICTLCCTSICRCRLLINAWWQQSSAFDLHFNNGLSETAKSMEYSLYIWTSESVRLSQYLCIYSLSVFVYL